MENINISLKKRVYFFYCNYDYKKREWIKNIYSFTQFIISSSLSLPYNLFPGFQLASG